MGERHRRHGGGLGFHRGAIPLLPPRSHPAQRGWRMRSAGGETMEVEGGRIVRSIGRKDRHSKVCTARGPRDRRVRLAAHTAIQFYDLQDRLGYDRPSKAVDWLIQNAKAAIDQLAELPRWTPAAASSYSTSCAPPRSSSSPTADAAAEPPSLKSVELPISSTAFAYADGGSDGVASFLPSSLEFDAIAETIKSFFPMAAAAAAAAASAAPSPPEFQDLRLSLQSFQDPIGHNYLGFDTIAGGWATEQSQRMSPWSVAETSGLPGGFQGFAFDVPPPEVAALHAVLGPSQLFSQRGPLQSSNPLDAVGWLAEHVTPPAELQEYPTLLRPSTWPMGFVPEAACSGFRLPARIQGEEQEQEQEEGGSISHELPTASRHWRS